jgi:hypothetical protein
VGKANENTNLHNEFQLQIWKLLEDSAMLLASNKQQYKEKTKNRKAQQDRQNTQEMTARKTKRSGLPRSSPFTRVYRIIQYTPNAENPKRNFSY